MGFDHGLSFSDTFNSPGLVLQDSWDMKFSQGTCDFEPPLWVFILFIHEAKAQKWREDVSLVGFKDGVGYTYIKNFLWLVARARIAIVYTFGVLYYCTSAHSLQAFSGQHAGFLTSSFFCSARIFGRAKLIFLNLIWATMFVSRWILPIFWFGLLTWWMNPRHKIHEINLFCAEKSFADLPALLLIISLGDGGGFNLFLLSDILLIVLDVWWIWLLSIRSRKGRAIPPTVGHFSIWVYISP